MYKIVKLNSQIIKKCPLPPLPPPPKHEKNTKNKIKPNEKKWNKKMLVKFMILIVVAVVGVD